MQEHPKFSLSSFGNMIFDLSCAKQEFKTVSFLRSFEVFVELCQFVADLEQK